MRQELAAAVGAVFFDDLRAHITRGAVIIVAESLDIVDVGVAVAQDDKTLVNRWIEDKLLRKPELVEIERWSRIKDDRWDSLVVAPFVLVEERVAPEKRPS